MNAFAWLSAFGWALVATAWVVLLLRIDGKGAGEPHVGLIPRWAIPGQHPLVSVIVPARNEEQNLPRCLDSLMAQRYDLFEIIVVDDESTDGTYAAAMERARRSDRMRVIEGDPLPAGWTGKNFALTEGVKAAEGEWLLFTDADTVHDSAALPQALGFALAHRIDLLSLTGLQECRGFWERAVQPLIFQLLEGRYRLSQVNDPSSREAAANGQFLLIRRDAYEQIGGHGAVAATLLEDVALARTAKAAGFRLYFAHAPELLAIRMYTSLREIWEGWSKNLFALADRSLLQISAAAAIVVGSALLPSLLLGVSLVNWLGGGAVQPLEWALPGVTGAFVLQGVMARRLGFNPLAGVLAPPGAGVVFAVLFNSTTKGLLGRKIIWKGRSIRASGWRGNR
jgi:chlorobactene glucosyltransferase